MLEEDKAKIESSEKDVDRSKLEQDLQDIKEEQNRRSIMRKLSDFIKKTFSRDKESTVAEDGARIKVLGKRLFLVLLMSRAE